MSIFICSILINLSPSICNADTISPTASASLSFSLLLFPMASSGGAAAPHRRRWNQRRWNRPLPMTLTYALSPTDVPDHIPRAEVEATLASALNRWAQVIPVSFAPAASYQEADVQIGFYAGNHGDGAPFKGRPGRVTAHAFYPEDGRMHFNAVKRWAVGLGKEAADDAVDLHETGHILGLHHSSNRHAVMYSQLKTKTRKVELDIDDIRRAQALYAPNPNFKFASEKTSGDHDSNPRSGGRRGGCRGGGSTICRGRSRSGLGFRRGSSTGEGGGGRRRRGEEPRRRSRIR